MPPKKKRKKKNSYQLALILILLIAGVVVLLIKFGPDNLRQTISRIFGQEKPVRVISPKPVPEEKPLPRVAIIIDDLGPNKRTALEALTIDAPLTLSILPQEVYSKWIAEEGYRIGREIIMHIPMEATRALRLGNGGLYTWMNDHEIASTIAKDIESVPYIIGASNHMGSAFTQNERLMKVVVSELKKRNLFFLDSLTTPKTVGYKIARVNGLRTIKRDIFLDNSKQKSEMEIQWQQMLRIAKKRGYAIVLAHARLHTLDYLHEKLNNNHEIRVVPISELID